MIPNLTKKPLSQKDKAQVLKDKILEMSMKQQCDKLRIELHRIAVMPDVFDALFEYRKWWDMQNIESEGENGWPMPFCFEYENIRKFAEYWKGDD